MSASLSGTPRDRSSVSSPADTSRSSSSKPSSSSARTRPRASCALRTIPTTIIPMGSWSQLAYPHPLRLGKGYADEGVARDDAGELLLAPAFGSRRAHRHHHVAHVGVGIVHAQRDAVRN